MCYMKATVRELHINTSALIKAVTKGETFIIELRGQPVAELRPFTRRVGRPLPDREEWIKKLPVSKTEMGRIMEEDRT
jgi:antitoxin (DNA-binding transcriptional repressor) of toxin-antitoxin stability system